MSTTPVAQEKIGLTLGTATPGGGFPVYGDAIVEIVNAADAISSV